jgi:hypothetical protein
MLFFYFSGINKEIYRIVNPFFGVNNQGKENKQKRCFPLL